MGKILILTRAGYKLYTSIIHRHPITGLLHGIFMPIACIGFFFCISAIWGARTAKKILATILIFMLCGWLTFEPWYGAITAIIYWLIINWALRRARTPEKTKLFIIGIAMIAFSTGVMEFIGHWYLEGQASNLREFLNSVYHTPLYGTLSFVKAVKSL